MEAPNEKVSDDGNVDYSDKQGEQNDPTAFESQADEILAQVKAYSRSLARETQVDPSSCCHDRNGHPVHHFNPASTI